MCVSVDEQVEADVLVSSWNGVSEETLAAALAQPVRQCIEAVLFESPSNGAEREQPAGDGLSLVVTTRSAYRHSIVRTFVEALRSRLPLTDDLKIRIHSAAQEALMNAVLHGNLRIDGALRGGLDGLIAAQAIIEARLDAPDIGGAMIRLDAAWTASDVEITVRDSGDGYDCSDVRPAAEDGASGRGLEILQVFSDRVTVLNGGTTVRLEFRR
ncbi:ATP-binding protein [Bradyrhizobium aeschynomenes]|uniref:ATP-binding protein n=1 Tax=Bradyrhizobium aeschynomenes TaxID=2734909 RepID=UPI0015539696|nr:ATP-binding protein [Bradyrhizobium aeschynomenes]NPV23751.1 ATP-binding protein [Bradyrhizobium aeschynomenes]